MERITDPDVLEPILNEDWAWAGFGIGDLEPELMQSCEWWRSGGSTVLLFDGLRPRLMCPYGDTSGLATILSKLDDERVWANIHPRYESTFRQFYAAEKTVAMRRMYLEVPVECTGKAIALRPPDRAEIEELLNTGEWVLFLPEALAGGHYYGVRENGRLVAVAGTHLASSRYNLAALGTVFTHPNHRGRGLAEICCSHVLASLGRAGIRRVVLNVEEKKATPRRIYEQLGFRSACTYMDGAYRRVSVAASDPPPRNGRGGGA